ncbi:DUF1120 domain-containing protein [Serratia fonticola]|uniref:DUF1120 domain-containing protein n=1 Tax=Serratia fonticola TaxID=47917 RepID=UPI0024DE61F7|nr:DUF1120 domain-containing protein [Serratia fonticola]MDK2375046.1 DUF1120 domain-containing protein [Serratia fonticola]
MSKLNKPVIATAVFLTSATVLLLATAQTFAAGQSAEITVTGQIIPGACTPSLTGGSSIDYQSITADNLKKEEYVLLPIKTVPFSIVCDAPMKAAIVTEDGRKDSVQALTGKSWEVKTGAVAADAKALGLGKSGDNNIGAWAMWMEKDTLKADGKVVNPIMTKSAPTEKSKWEKPTSGATWMADTSIFNSWSADDKDSPSSFTTLNGVLSVQAGLNKASQLDLSQSIRFNGLATIQIVYL